MHHGVPLTRITLLDCRVCKKLARGPRDARICVECIDDIHRALRCPDCDSDVTIAVTADGILSANVNHADTCPWYVELERNGGSGIRFGRRAPGPEEAAS
jgi:hypothetical protein